MSNGGSRGFSMLVCGPEGPLRWPFARIGRDLPLPKPFRGAILASKPPGIWRMSVDTQHQ